jgi:fumarylacetoacetate (FAA) hydrolase
VNDISLRNLISGGALRWVSLSSVEAGFRAFTGSGDGRTSLARVARRQLHGPLKVDLNGQPFGRADAGEDMTFDFGTLVAPPGEDAEPRRGHHRRLGHRLQSRRGRRTGQADRARRTRLQLPCRVRTVETILDGEAATPFLKHGDTGRIWMDDESGHPIFGTIEQQVVPA